MSIFVHTFAISDEISINNAVKSLEDKDFNKAIVQYDSLIKNVSNASLYYGRGMAYYYKDQYDSAAQDFNKAILLDVKYDKAYLGLAMSYIQSGKEIEAVNILNSAINDGIITGELRYIRGLIMYMEQDYRAAILDYDFVLSDNNSVELYNDALYGRAISYYKLSDYINAKADFEECLQLIKDEVIKNECERLLIYVNKQIK